VRVLPAELQPQRQSEGAHPAAHRASKAQVANEYFHEPLVIYNSFDKKSWKSKERGRDEVETADTGMGWTGVLC
jgi:hypothetical protein